MKLLSFTKNGKPRIGAINAAGRVVDVTALGGPETMNDVITRGDTMLGLIADALADAAAASYELRTINFANVTNPEKILCVGLNYKAHATEMAAAAGSQPEHIVFFSKFNDALTPARKSVTLPQWQSCYDYEAELVIVIGKTAWNVSREQAPDYVFGYTCGNDLSARDSQFLTGQWLSGKSFPGFAPAGPLIVTADSFQPDAANKISCTVNGALVQSAVTSDMIFSCAEIVSAASRYFRLKPGDLIFTGTPSGVNLGKPESEREWLKAGDVVRVQIDGIGTLETPLV